MENLKEKKNKGGKTDKTFGGKMFVVNIKSRHIQTPKRYVELFNKLKNEDPLIPLQGNKYISIKNLFSTETQEEPGVPKMIYGKLTTYDLLDPEAFYNRKKKEIVDVKLDPDIVANIKEMDFYFLPKFHRLTFSSRGKITLNQVLKFFDGGFVITEGDGEVDVNTVKSQDIIDRILKANKIYSLEASITFSNKDLSDGFYKLFDEKARETEARKIGLNFTGTKDEPLNAVGDGLVNAVVKVSQSNGVVKAAIQEVEGAKTTRINTGDYPMIIECERRETNFFAELYSKFSSIFGGK